MHTLLASAQPNIYIYIHTHIKLIALIDPQGFERGIVCCSFSLERETHIKVIALIHPRGFERGLFGFRFSLERETHIKVIALIHPQGFDFVIRPHMLKSQYPSTFTDKNSQKSAP